jgi:hypothetical protein
MNPRLVEPGFAVVCLHADVPARPGKDENREDDAQVERQHGRSQDTCTARRCARASTSRQRIEPRCLSTIGLARSSCDVMRNSGSVRQIITAASVRSYRADAAALPV